MFWFGAREAVVEKVAVYLRPRLQPDDLLDAEEVGTLTYWAGCRVIDHAGLVTRRERVELGEVDRVAAHRRNLAREPHLRWLVMNEADLPLHAGLFDPASLVEFDQPSLEDVPWRLWVAEVPRPAAHPGGGESN
jgi:hypothetical protein